MLSEALGTTPMIVNPKVNAAHVRHPAWAGHVAVLRAAGVVLVEGELLEPRVKSGGGMVPWREILDRVKSFHGC